MSSIKDIQAGEVYTISSSSHGTYDGLIVAATDEWKIIQGMWCRKLIVHLDGGKIKRGEVVWVQDPEQSPGEVNFFRMVDTDRLIDEEPKEE